MNHTVSGQAWRNLWFNGTLVGETGINAALCGHWGCPVLLVTGDEATCAEGRDLLGCVVPVCITQALPHSLRGELAHRGAVTRLPALVPA